MHFTRLALCVVTELALCCGTGCATWLPPTPPPTTEIPTPPALWPTDPRLVSPALSGAAAAPPSTEVTPPSVEVTLPSVEVTPPSATTSVPKAVVHFEEPYKLGERLQERGAQSYRETIRDYRHWGKGGTGELLAPLPGPTGHPDPRVTINVERIKGGHDGNDVQRLLRRNHWIQVVRCYRLGAYKDAELRGATKALIGITRSGEVVKPKLLQTALHDPAVAECLVNRLRTLRMPAARAPSTAWLELRVAPGDEPMPPPEELLVPGDGTLSLQAMTKGVEAGRSDIEACYRAAFAYAPGLWGRLLLRFHLTARGKLDEVFEAGTQFPDTHVSQCVVHAARTWRFPKPQGGELRFVVGLRLQSDRSKHELPPLPAKMPPSRPFPSRR